MHIHRIVYATTTDDIRIFPVTEFRYKKTTCFLLIKFLFSTIVTVIIITNIPILPSPSFYWWCKKNIDMI